GAGVCWSQSPRTSSTLGLQEPGSPPAAPPAAIEPPQPSPSPEDKPGLLHEMGKLFDKILPHKKTGAATDPSPPPKEAAPAGGTDGGTNALRTTGETLSRLATPSTMVSGRSACPVMADRTTDCKLGADKLCQSKGYKEGKSLNTDAAEHCSPKVLIPGRARKPDDCRTDTYVTSALCQ
ncbi:MAG: hypothetical protein ABW213_16470, partial [Tardiphaga sp.]